MSPTPALFPLLASGAMPMLMAARVPARLPLDTVVVSDAMAFLIGLPDASVDCVVTSPPYFGLRDYGVEGQIGLEPTPAEFVATMVTVFREVRRVLKASGTVWLNLGDSYSGSGKGGNPEGSEWSGFVGNKMREQSAMPSSKIIYPGLKSKDLMMIPARVAIALQDDGWYLRSEIVWSKPNPMPESVTDRPTKAHEMVYLLTKCERYWYDADAVREDATGIVGNRKMFRGGGSYVGGNSFDNSAHRPNEIPGNTLQVNVDRNRRSVWTVATEPTPFAHFATFPRKLIEPMILAGCPAQVCAVCGAPYERMTERETNWQERRLAGAIGDNRKAANVTMQKTHGTGMSHDLGTKAINDLGFHPTCQCDGATRPGVVLDMFMGSGTVALVARHHNRHYIGCDLNPAYVALARERLRQPFEPHHVVRNETLDDLPLFAGMEQS